MNNIDQVMRQTLYFLVKATVTNFHKNLFEFGLSKNCLSQ